MNLIFRRGQPSPYPHYIFYMFCVLLATPAIAQHSSSVRGTVTDRASGDVLIGANVYLESTNRGAVTDAEGRFVIDRIPGGKYILLCRFVGYRTFRKDVTLASNETLRLEINLEVESIMMQSAVVSATRERQSKAEIPLSIGSVDRAAIAAANPAHPSDILGRIPGVWVNQTSGEGHMTAIRQPLSIEPLYLFLENGVPTRSTGFFNHNALYEINVPQAEGIEVIKGPGTALYGSDAIGGVINVTSRPAPATAEGELVLEGGSFGFKRALVSGGTTIGRNGLRLDVNVTDSDGWRNGTGYSRQSATLRWDRRMGSSSQVRTVVSFANVDQGPAGIAAISEEDYHANPRLNYQPISYREVQAYRISAAYERVAEDALFSVTPYARFNTMNLLPNWSLTFDPTIWDTQNYSLGALLKYRKDYKPLRSRVIVGADLDLSPGRRTEYAITPTREGKIFTSYAMGGTIYDYDVTYRQASPYVHAEFSPTRRLRTSVGLRIDLTGYGYENKLSVVEDGSHRRPASTTKTFAHASPKVGLTYQLSDNLNAFTAYRHAFRVPSESQLFRQGSSTNTVDLRPVKVDNIEAGLRARAGSAVDVEITAYYMSKRDDIVQFVNADGTRGSVNAGKTSHKGVEFGLNAGLSSDFEATLSYSYAVHRYEEWETQIDEDYSGNEMEVAPRAILNASAAYTFPIFDGLTLAVEWNRLGSYWMDPENASKYDGHDVINLRTTLQLLSNFSILARVGNLTDKLYAERATYNTFRGDEFAPGLPRTLNVALRYGL